MSGRNLRRIAGFASVVVLALAGCSSETKTATSTTPVDIEFWNYWDGNNGKAVNALVQQYNATHSNVHVKVVTLPWGELLPKMQAGIAAKSPPAVAAADIAWMARLHRSGALLALDDAVKSKNVNLDDFYPAMLEYGRYNGKLESLPVSTNNLALFYNKDLFKAAGLDPEKPPKTWTELRDAAAKIKALGGGVNGFEVYQKAGGDGEGVTWQFQPYLWQAGGEFLNSDNTKAAFNTPAGKKALQFLVDLIQKDKVAGVGAWDGFDKGQTAMRIEGSWMVSIWNDQVKFKFGTAQIPIPDGGKPATNMGGEQIFVFKTTPEKQAAAVDFATWFASPKIQVQWDLLTAFMPVRKSVAADPDFRSIVSQDPKLVTFVDQQQYAHARPPIPQYPDASLAFAKELEKAYYGVQSVDSALSNAEKAVNAALGK